MGARFRFLPSPMNPIVLVRSSCRNIIVWRIVGVCNSDALTVVELGGTKSDLSGPPYATVSVVALLIYSERLLIAQPSF